MTTFTSFSDRWRQDSDHRFKTVDYTSNVLQLFMEGLDGRPSAQVLDLGPVCQENIRFLARRVKRLYVCDMFIRLERCLGKGDPVDRIWHELDYPPESFDGILIWELADRLDDREVRALVKLCHTLLKPGGMAVVLVLGEQAASLGVNSFVVGQNFKVRLRSQPHLHLPIRGRQNRDVLAMMTPLKPAKSFICRLGFMEFLFTRD
ncbi:MAG: class I SAM-dependent methyltransferase [Desulfobacteraceae bacterium]|nr:class I SAM-dependent methyltransferase [Desulfobacteraceae bacterium]